MDAAMAPGSGPRGEGPALPGRGARRQDRPVPHSDRGADHGHALDFSEQQSVTGGYAEAAGTCDRPARRGAEDDGEWHSDYRDSGGSWHRCARHAGASGQTQRFPELEALDGKGLRQEWRRVYRVARRQSASAAPCSFSGSPGRSRSTRMAAMGRIQSFRPPKGLDFRRQQSVHGCTDTPP